jgi:hypothetical protein
MRSLLLSIIGVYSCLAQTPSITNVTNSALPGLDSPPNSVILAPRSLASVWGANLASRTAATAPPWQKSLGGVEVHLAGNSCFDSSCEDVADLLYVSPTLINFVVPDGAVSCCDTVRVVLIKDGIRYDDRGEILGGPGRVVVDPQYNGDYSVVFGVGYDCLFSFSLTDPSACGLSWSQGQHRALLGAVTDISGQLITSQNPAHQDEIIILWMTGLTRLKLDAKSGLLQQTSPDTVYFGVAQYGKDIPTTVGFGFNGEIGQFQSQPALFAGESPTYVGLDQVNMKFPVCTSAVIATTEKRYDAFLTYTSIETGTNLRVYLPFVISPGDPDCDWRLDTTTTLIFSVNPSTLNQSVTFTATVSSSAATGTISFLDGATMLGSSTLKNGAATLIPTLSAGNHTITATYGGDDSYRGSSATRIQTVRAATTMTLTSSANPSISGQPLIFTASVSPSAATGTVTFSNGNSTLGVGTLVNGKATCGPGSPCPTSGLGPGNLTIKATYNGDSGYGGSSSTLTQAVTGNTTTTITSSANLATISQTVTFTATVSCCMATGTVTFFDGSSTLGSGTLVYTSTSGVIRATFSTVSLSLGTHTITARYNGDSTSNASTSAALTETIWAISLTSSPNPSVSANMITLTACGIPHGTTGTVAFSVDGTVLLTNTILSVPCSSVGTNVLTVGTHTITAHYSDSQGGNTSASVTQTVNAH